MDKVSLEFEQPGRIEMQDYRVKGIAKKAASLLLQESINNLCNSVRNNPWNTQTSGDEHGEKMAQLAREHVKHIKEAIANWERAKSYFDEVNK